MNRMFYGIMLIAGFSIVVAAFTLYFALAGYLDPELIGTMTTEEIQLYVSQNSTPYYLIPVLSLIGLVVGSLAFQFLSNGEKGKVKADSILKLFDPPERMVIGKLLENDGKVQQIELSRLPGLNKVRTHRILNEMERKKIIKRERYGKLNLIVLDKDLLKALG